MIERRLVGRGIRLAAADGSFQCVFETNFGRLEVRRIDVGDVVGNRPLSSRQAGHCRLQIAVRAAEIHIRSTSHEPAHIRPNWVAYPSTFGTYRCVSWYGGIP